MSLINLIVSQFILFYSYFYKVSANMPCRGNETISNGSSNQMVVNKVPNLIKWSPLHPSDMNAVLFDQYAVIILNQPILIPTKLMVNLWNSANVRMTVDGGTARWYKFCDDAKRKNLQINCLHPDIVSGDFDSLPNIIIDLAKKNGCEVLRTPDQNYTDFRKALQILHDKNLEINTIIAVVENSGRLDQTLANLNTHFMIDSIFMKDVNLYSLASDSLTWLLKPGKHSICIPERLRASMLWCSLMPVGGPANVTTSGLYYNMCDRKIEFGGLVSSSNSYNGDEVVTVETDGNVLWSMGLGFDDN
ncbi:thiamine pyrophosphokinase 1-like isoform X2 [Lycorma delicatula]|uniref:thiamine pyrophosphokinase 1-like isoform X2 n=1 Tax=Lycorma delicatula TaxID=130591 RepID=UPI003F514E7C